MFHARWLFVLPLLHLLTYASALGGESATPEPRRVSRKIANLPSKVSTQVETREVPVYHDQSGTGLALFLGAGGGKISVSGGEPAAGGSLLQGRAGITFHNPSVALDLSLGWMYSQIQGAYTQVSPNKVSSTQTAVLTRAGSLEFSPRYKVLDWLELGPAASVLFGTNASFSEDVEGSSSPIFLGGKLAATYATHELFFRLSAQVSSSITIPDRSAMLASGALEIGIPLVRGNTVIREKQVNTVRDNYSRETFEVEVPVVKELVAFSFDDQVVHFEFDRSELSLDSESFLGELGRYLASHPGLFDQVTVDGHTDQRGSVEYNQKLSEDRVAAVKRVLARAGLSEDRIQTRAMGKTHPIDRGVAEISHARNRRVEMSFSNVTDTRALRDAINQIRFATIRPATCQDGHCR